MNTAVQTHYIELGSSLHSFVQGAESFISKIRSTVSIWAARSNDRQQLSQMNSRMLADIGLNYGDVARESSKFFWQR
jgi:uncharacterized protein YjiS (DUF1127 family)|tara:strand:+ start:6422 stop:6652 length:231 start_codon:yes stop_codon:yes gene_type:complete